MARILIVEDEPVIAAVLQQCLELHGHDVVGPVSTPSAASSAMNDVPNIEYALVDVNLHGEPSGIDIARNLTGHGIPVIFASGDRTNAWKRRHDAIGLLPKPYQIETLLATITALENSQDRSQPIHFPESFIPFAANA